MLDYDFTAWISSYYAHMEIGCAGFGALQKTGVLQFQVGILQNAALQAFAVTSVPPHRLPLKTPITGDIRYHGVMRSDSPYLGYGERSECAPRRRTSRETKECSPVQIRGSKRFKRKTLVFCRNQKGSEG